MGAGPILLKRLETPEAIARADEITPHLSRICERNGKWTLGGLWGEIGKSLFQVWTVEAGFIQGLGLTHVVPHMNNEKWVHVVAMVGSESANWSHLLSDLAEEVRRAGYDGLQVECRPGWAKACKAAGLRETHRIFEVKLNGE